MASAPDAALLARRRGVLSSALSLTGAKDGDPLHIVRAQGVRLYSPEGGVHARGQQPARVWASRTAQG